MVATILEIGATKLNAKLKQYCGVKLQDDTGEQHSVTINAGNKGLPQFGTLNQRCAFSVSTYQGRNGLAYSGFFDGPVGGRQASPQTPQGPQASPPTLSQGSTRDTSIERQACFKAACDRFTGMNDVAPTEVLGLAVAGYQFVQTGQLPASNPLGESQPDFQ